MMSFAYRFLSLPLLFGIVACAAADQQNVADRAPTEMVGLSREDVARCAGRPTRRNTDGNSEFWTYIRTTGGDDYSQIETPGPRQYGPLPTEQGSRCVVRMRFEEGKLVAIDYNTQGSNVLIKRQRVCGQILQHCLRK